VLRSARVIAGCFGSCWQRTFCSPVSERPRESAWRSRVCRPFAPSGLGDRLKGPRVGHSNAGRPRRALVVLEIAAAVVLMLGASLLTRSFVRYQAVERGFVGENVLTASITLPPARYADGPARQAFFDNLVDRLRSIPQVESAVVSTLALSGMSMTTSWPLGRPDASDAREVGFVSGIADRHFYTFGIPVLEGRECAGAADSSAIVVNASMARLAFPQRSALGQALDLSRVSMGVRTIVGVVSDVRNIETKAAPLPRYTSAPAVSTPATV
jgi:hypothetical protein